MRLTTSSCQLGGIISARMKRWQLSGSTVGYVIGLPAFVDGPVWCRKRSRWSTPPSHCLPPTTSIEQRQNSPCHCLLNTLGLAACQRGFTVGFTTAASLVHQLLEARDERRLLKLQQQLQSCKLLIVDELGYVPLSSTGGELLFETFSQRYERGSTIVTSNLPFDEWTGVFGNERLTGALLDRLTHHVHILEMNGESYRLKHSIARRQTKASQ